MTHGSHEMSLVGSARCFRFGLPWVPPSSADPQTAGDFLGTAPPKSKTFNEPVASTTTRRCDGNRRMGGAPALRPPPDTAEYRAVGCLVVCGCQELGEALVASLKHLKMGGRCLLVCQSRLDSLLGAEDVATELGWSMGGLRCGEGRGR